MATALINGRVVLRNEIRSDRCVVIEDGRIAGVSEAVPSDAELVDLAGQLLLPGFIDVQVNGGGGRLFNDDPSVETIAAMAAAHRRFGTTGLLPTLISDDFSVIGRAIAKAANRFGVRILEFSVQGNHMHLIVEAAAHEALSRAMQGFSIRVAKGLNAMMKRRGRVFADRYHAHILETPPEARWAVLYVRRNYQKHMSEIGKPISPDYVDPFASPGANIEIAEPRTWLLRRAAAPP